MRDREGLIDAILKDEFKISLAKLQTKGQTARVSRIRRALIVVLRNDFNFKYKAILPIVNRKHANCAIQYQTHKVLLENPLRDPEYIKVYNKLFKRLEALKDPELIRRRMREIDNSIHSLTMERDQLRLKLEFPEKNPKLYYKKVDA